MDPEFLALMAVAFGGGAFVKGATGMGLPLVALPILAASLGVPHAIAVMAVPIIVSNVWQVWHYRACGGRARFLTGMLATGAVGIGIGTWLLTELSEAALSLGLSLMLMAYIALSITKPSFRIAEAIGRRIAPAVGFAAGALQGATGISAPIGVPFIHAMRLERDTYVFAVSAMFLLFALVQLPALALAGIMTWARLLEGAVALIPVLIMMPVGGRVAGMLSRRTFDRIILGLLAVIAVQLMLKAVGS